MNRGRWCVGWASIPLLLVVATSAGCLTEAIRLPAPGEEARALLAETEDPAPSAGSTRAFLQRAAAFLSMGQLNQAQDAVDRALLRAPDEPGGNVMAARVLVARGELDRALVHYVRARGAGRSLGAAVRREHVDVLLALSRRSLKGHRPSASLRYLRLLRQPGTRLGPETALKVNELALAIVEELLDARRSALAREVLAEIPHGVGRGDGRWAQMTLRARLIDEGNDAAEEALWAWASEDRERRLVVAEMLLSEGRSRGVMRQLQGELSQPDGEPGAYRSLLQASDAEEAFPILAQAALKLAAATPEDERAVVVLMDSASRLELAGEGARAVPLLAAAVRRSSDPRSVYGRLVTTVREAFDESTEAEARTAMDQLVTSLSVDLLSVPDARPADLLAALRLVPGQSRAYGERILTQVLSSSALPQASYIAVLESLHAALPARARALATQALGGSIAPEEGSLERARILRLAGFASQAHEVAASLVDDPTDGAQACVLLGRLIYEGGESDAGDATHWLREAVRRAAVANAMAIQVAEVALAVGDVHAAEDLLPERPGEGDLVEPWLRVRMALDLDSDPVDLARVRRHVASVMVAQDHPRRIITLRWLLTRLHRVSGLSELRGELVEALAEALPDDPVFRGRLADHRLSRGDVEGAVALWTQGEPRHLEGDGLRLGLARKLMSGVYVEEGFQLLLGRPVNAVSSPDLLILMAELCLQRSRPLWAQAYVERLLSAHYAWTGKNRGKLKSLADRLLDAGEVQLAVECWKRVLAGRPRDPQVMVGLGEAMLAAGRQEEARQLFERALQRQSRNHATLIQIAAVYERSEDLPAAIALLRPKAAKGNSSLFKRVQELYRLSGDYEGFKALAIERARVLVSGRNRAHRRSVNEVVSIAGELEAVGEPQAARQILAESIVAQPQNQSLLAAAARNALRLGQPTLAMEHMGRGLGLRSATQRSWSTTLGEWIDQGHLAAAERLVEASSPAVLSDPQMLLHRGRLALARGEPAEAEGLLADGLRGAEDPEEYLIALRSLLHTSGHPGLLRRLYRRVPVSVSQSPRHDLRLARLALSDGLVDDSERLYASFLARAERGALDVARAYGEESALDRAIGTYMDALEQQGHTRETFPLPELVQMLAEAGRGDEVPRVIKRYLSRQEAPAAAALQVFAAYKLMGDIPAALTWLDRADQLEPRADHDRTRGELLLSQEELEGAREAFLRYINREALGVVGTTGRRRRHRAQTLKGISSRADRASALVVRSYERRGLYGEARRVITAVEKSLGQAPWLCVTDVRFALLEGDIQGGLRRLRADLASAVKAPRDDVVLLMEALEGRQRSGEAAWFLRRILNQRWDTDLGLVRLQQLLVAGLRAEAHAQGVEIALRGGTSGRVQAAELALQAGSTELAALLIDVPGLPLGEDLGIAVDRVREKLQVGGRALTEPRRAITLDPRVEGLLAAGAPGGGGPALLEALKRDRGMGQIARHALVELAALEDPAMFSRAVELIGDWGHQLQAEERWDQMAIWLEASHRPCEAARLLEEGLALNRAAPQRVLALISASRRCGDEARRDRALAWAMELWDGEPVTLLKIGRRLLEHGDLQRAREVLSRVPRRGGLPGMERAIQETWLGIRSRRPVPEIMELIQEVYRVAPAPQRGREAVWQMLLDLERPELAFEAGEPMGEGAAMSPLGRSLAARLAWATGRHKLARALSEAGVISGSQDGVDEGLRALRAAVLANDDTGAARLVHQLTLRSGAEGTQDRVLFSLIRALEEMEAPPGEGLTRLVRRVATASVSQLSDASPRRVTVEAILRELAGDVEGSLSIYERAAARYRDESVHVNNYAYALVCQKRNIPLAVQLIESAVGSSYFPLPSALDTEAWALFHVGRHEDALVSMGAALHHRGLRGDEGPVVSSELLLHLGMIQRATGSPAADVTLGICANEGSPGRHQRACRRALPQSPSQSPM